MRLTFNHVIPRVVLHHAGKKKLDKRGFRAEKATENLRRFYALEGENEGERGRQDRMRRGGAESEEDEGSELEDEEGGGEDQKAKAMRPGWARARGLGGGAGSSSSGSGSSSEGEDGSYSEAESDEVGDEVEEDWSAHPMQDEAMDSVQMLPEATRRIAVVSLDWDHVKAKDIFVVVRSFVPKRGAVEKVTVYPSDYGLEAMKRDQEVGPALASRARKGEKETSEEALVRRYELQKLRYYYAIVECDSARTAMAIYSECDGMEFERSGNLMDLRFVPDENDFSCRQVRDAALPADIDALLASRRGYMAPEFESKALQHTRPELTWDKDDDGERGAVLTEQGRQHKDDKLMAARGIQGKKNKKIVRLGEDEIKENDFQAYLASESSEEDEEDGGEADGGRGRTQSKKESKREEMRRLLLGGDEGASNVYGTKSASRGGDLQVSFAEGLEDLPARVAKRKKEIELRATETPFETGLRLRKEKKKERKKAERGAKGVSGSDDDAAGDGLYGDVEDDGGGFFVHSDDEDEDGERGASNKWAKGDKASKKRGGAAKAPAAPPATIPLPDDFGDNDPDSDSDDGYRKRKKGFRERLRERKAVRRAEREAKEDQRKAIRRARAEGLDMVPPEENAGHPSRKDEDPKPKMEVDPRFAATLDDPAFAVDPTDPSYKDSEFYRALRQERVKRRNAEINHVTGEAADPPRSSKKKSRLPKDGAEAAVPAQGAALGDDFDSLVARLKKKVGAGPTQ